MRSLLLILLASSTAFADPKPGPCPEVTKNLGRILGWFKSPEGCKMKPGDQKYKLLKTRGELMTHLRCLDPKDVKGPDFAKDQLVMWTPIFAKRQNGVDAFDDGKTLTMVKMFGNTCPKDPPIVPGKPVATRAFYLGAGARTIKEVTCTKEWRCGK
ncbi:MAG: hypothetical protein H0V17_32160 [Deltaproteobacteria bacterium]|nr:hypothetical protein [Deltaproteobacteria bacterium]